MKSQETRSSPNFRTSSIPCWISSGRSTATFWNRSKRSLERAGALVTHRDLLKYIENRDLKGYKNAIEEHFRLYSIYLERHKK